MTALSLRLDDPDAIAVDPADIERGAKVRPLPPLPAYARQWLTDHAAALAKFGDVCDDAKPLPTRPHELGQHSMIGLGLDLIPVQTRLADRNDPLAWLLASESWAERAAHATSAYDRSLLADAERALTETGRREPGWTGKPSAQRTAERHAHNRRVARDAGQGSFGGPGFEP